MRNCNFLFVIAAPLIIISGCATEAYTPLNTSPYPASTVHCTASPTAVVSVTNPTTGKTWMDRNLGAIQVATSSTDANAFGDLYQWGRGADGHQCRNSATTTSISTTYAPTHGNFILAPNAPYCWVWPNDNNLWQGLNGINNPCPNGYRLPTLSELEAERLSWSINNGVGAFASPLKLPLAGDRNYDDGAISNSGYSGFYWSSTIGTLGGGSYLSFYYEGANAGIGEWVLTQGLSVRCIKD